MRTLVTGASGFSGSIVAGALAAAGFEVVATYRRETPLLAGLAERSGIVLVRADIAESACLPGPFEAIVHAAATSPGPGIGVGQIVQDNLFATFALIDSALAWQTRHFVYFSSMSVYGEIAVPVVDEATAIRNPDAYGASKLLAEARLREVAGRLPGLALRLPGIVGPGARRNWLSGVAARLRDGAPVQAFHLDRPFNNAVHVADIAALVAAVLQRGWDGFDAIVLAARGMTTVGDAVRQLARGLGVPARLDSVPEANASFTLSCERAIARWGYDPMEIGSVIDRYARDLVAAGG